MPRNEVHEALVDLVKEAGGSDEFMPGSNVFIFRSEREEMELYYAFAIGWLENSNWICTCPGWRFTGNCKHIKFVTEEDAEEL